MWRKKLLLTIFLIIFSGSAAYAACEWPSWFKPQDYEECRWRGTAPICKGKCESGEIQILTDRSGCGGRRCETGSKVYCCKPKQTSFLKLWQ